MFNQIPLYAGKRIQAELIPRAAIFASEKLDYLQCFHPNEQESPTGN